MMKFCPFNNKPCIEEKCALYDKDHCGLMQREYDDSNVVEILQQIQRNVR